VSSSDEDERLLIKDIFGENAAECNNCQPSHTPGELKGTGNT